MDNSSLDPIEAIVRNYLLGEPLKRTNTETPNNDEPREPKRRRGRPKKVVSPIDYEVEAILNKRFVQGGVEYLLKWKDFPDSQNSWVPIANMNADELIAAFESTANT